MTPDEIQAARAASKRVREARRLSKRAARLQQMAEMGDKASARLEEAREYHQLHDRARNRLETLQRELEAEKEPSQNPFLATSESKVAGWTTRPDGSLECSGGPLVCRVKLDSKRPGYVWSLHCHSWVEPILVELSTGRAMTLSEAQLSATLTGRKELTMWIRRIGGVE